MTGRSAQQRTRSGDGWTKDTPIIIDLSDSDREDAPPAPMPASASVAAPPPLLERLSPPPSPSPVPSPPAPPAHRRRPVHAEGSTPITAVSAVVAAVAAPTALRDGEPSPALASSSSSLSSPSPLPPADPPLFELSPSNKRQRLVRSAAASRPVYRPEAYFSDQSPPPAGTSSAPPPKMSEEERQRLRAKMQKKLEDKNCVKERIPEPDFTKLTKVPDYILLSGPVLPAQRVPGAPYPNYTVARGKVYANFVDPDEVDKHPFLANPAVYTPRDSSNFFYYPVAPLLAGEESDDDRNGEQMPSEMSPRSTRVNRDNRSNGDYQVLPDVKIRHGLTVTKENARPMEVRDRPFDSPDTSGSGTATGQGVDAGSGSSCGPPTPGPAALTAPAAFPTTTASVVSAMRRKETATLTVAEAARLGDERERARDAHMLAEKRKIEHLAGQYALAKTGTPAGFEFWKHKQAAIEQLTKRCERETVDKVVLGKAAATAPTDGP